MLLTIVVPFHNSHAKSRRLIETLQSLRADDVEAILIDDGGTLAEAELLEADAGSLSIPSQHVRQRNAGPGGARNRGLSWAHGKYVWFVDSDDDFNPDAIEVLRQKADEDYNFIDFQFSSRTGVATSMKMEDGEHNSPAPQKLMTGFGRFWTKIFKRDFLIDRGLFYPENCLFEDNALSMIVPMEVTRFYKSDVIGYTHQTDSASVTRTAKLSPRYFDRLDTAEYGLTRVLSRYPMPGALKETTLSKFSSIFLRVTITALRNHGSNPVVIQRVMRRYQDLMALFDAGPVMKKQFELVLSIITDQEERAIYQLLWDNTDRMADPRPYFAGIRATTWKRDIVFRETPMRRKSRD